MIVQTVVLTLAYVALLCIAGAVLACALTYILASAGEHAERVAARRAAYDVWVRAQPAAYHEQRMIETYR